MRALAILFMTATPGLAGGLVYSAPPPERPSYSPIMEPERCERPVYGRNGNILYWTGNGCVPPVVDGNEGMTIPERPEPEEPKECKPKETN